MHALRVLTEVPEQPDPLGELGVVRRHGACVAERAEVLAGVEAERCEAAEASDAPAPVPGAVRLTGVLDECDAAVLRESQQRVDIDGMSVEVDGDDRTRPLGDGRRRWSTSMRPFASESTRTTRAPRRRAGRQTRRRCSRAR